MKLYLANTTLLDDDYTPRYIIDKKSITIYNFTCVDEHGYTNRTDFIELTPTNETYNLLGPQARKIIIDKKSLEIKAKREIIVKAIRKALVQLNCASEMDNIYILKDLSILVASDDWADYHELLLS
jgi:hypothetical protein